MNKNEMCKNKTTANTALTFLLKPSLTEMSIQAMNKNETCENKTTANTALTFLLKPSLTEMSIQAMNKNETCKNKTTANTASTFACKPSLSTSAAQSLFPLVFLNRENLYLHPTLSDICFTLPDKSFQHGTNSFVTQSAGWGFSWIQHN